MTAQLSDQLADWMTYDQVVAATGIPRRTLERQVSAGRWNTLKRSRHGTRPETVFDPDQVRQAIPAPLHQVVKADSAMSAKAAETQEPMVPVDIAEIAAVVCERVLMAIAPRQEEPKALFVDLTEASTITGLSEGCLRKLVEEGKILHTKDRSKDRHYRVIKVRRADLETFEP